MAGSELLERIVKVLTSTDHVNKKDIEPLTSLTVTEAVTLASALRDVVEGEAPLDTSMQRFIDTLKRTTRVDPRWQLVTVLPTLIEPKTYPWVRPSAVREQAKSLAPNMKVGTKPNGRIYAHVWQMFQHMTKRLTAEGLTPRDMIDVTDFCWATLRPSARKRLAELLASRKHPVAQSDDEAEANAA